MRLQGVPTLVPLLIGLTLSGAAGMVAPASSQEAKQEDARKQAKESAVTILTAGLSSTSARLAEDIRHVYDGLETSAPHVLPVLGRGGGQSLIDLLREPGVDMAVIHQDHLQWLKAEDPALYGKVEDRVRYIVKLSNSEFQVLARKDIETYADLRGKKVSVSREGSATAIGAEKIFRTLGIEVEPVFHDQALAEEKLRSGEIDAIARFDGAPSPAFQSFKAVEGFHFVPLGPESLPDDKFYKLLDFYLPAPLTHEAYPDLIPEGQAVPTVANGTLLAVSKWPEDSERYRKIAKFVTILFDNIEKFRHEPRHPKWKEINLAAEVKGWTRFKAAQDWLDANTARSLAQTKAMKASFETFLLQAHQGKTDELASEAREALFKHFMQWWRQNQGQ